MTFAVSDAYLDAIRRPTIRIPPVVANDLVDSYEGPTTWRAYFDADGFFVFERIDGTAG